MSGDYTQRTSKALSDMLAPDLEQQQVNDICGVEGKRRTL